MNKKCRDEESQTEIIKLFISRAHLLELIFKINETIDDTSLSDNNVRAIVEKIILSNLKILKESGLLFLGLPKSLEAHE